MNKRHLFLRVLVSPFVLCLILIGFNYTGLRRFILFMRYGGEFVAFEKNDRATLDKLYLIAKEMLEKQEKEEQK